MLWLKNQATIIIVRVTTILTTSQQLNANGFINIDESLIANQSRITQSKATICITFIAMR